MRSSKKALKPARRRSLVTWVRECFQVSTARACRLAQIERAFFYRKSQAKDQSPLMLRIREFAHARPRFGYQRIHVLLRREGMPVNKKRVRRLCRLQGLQLRMRMRRRKHMCLHRGPAPTATRSQERWSIHFVHDQLINGRPFRIPTVVDQWSRFSPILEVGFSMSGQSVAEALDRYVSVHGAPISITVDHGTEFTSKALEEWAYRRGVKLDFIHPGKPTENGHIESVNDRLRDECLNVEQFWTIEDARRKIITWRDDYNEHRPHSSPGHLTPSEFAANSRTNGTSEALIFQSETV